MDENEHPKIEVFAEQTDSGDNHQYNNSTALPLEERRDQLALAVIGLVLAVPFPVLIISLWLTLNGIKADQSTIGEGAMNAVALYLLQFFVVPLTTLASVIIGFIVTSQSKMIARRVGYVSLGLTAVGFVILGLFLNLS
jgi:hypothetical protein